MCCGVGQVEQSDSRNKQWKEAVERRSDDCEDWEISEWRGRAAPLLLPLLTHCSAISACSHMRLSLGSPGARMRHANDMSDYDLVEGLLYKYTNVVKGFQYRWFILDPSRGTLEYFMVSLLSYLTVCHLCAH